MSATTTRTEHICPECGLACWVHVSAKAAACPKCWRVFGVAREPQYYAINRHNRTACALTAVCWEQVQAMFRVGIQMPDGDLATGIGRCKREEFGARVAHSGLRLLVR